jgi:hypothetical protein
MDLAPGLTLPPPPGFPNVPEILMKATARVLFLDRKTAPVPKAREGVVGTAEPPEISANTGRSKFHVSENTTWPRISPVTQVSCARVKGGEGEAQRQVKGRCNTNPCVTTTFTAVQSVSGAIWLVTAVAGAVRTVTDLPGSAPCAR